MENLQEVLKLHKMWLNKEKGGFMANLRGADLSVADLSGANLRGADLSVADLSGADLHVADLSGANLREADLHGADLSGADLSGANLSWANLHGADLSGADLSGADLSWANLREANLSWADLSGADLRGAIGNLRHIKSLQIDFYSIVYTDTMLSIGCQSHPIESWKSFNDEKIAKMATNSLAWWQVWKPIIFNIIKTSPAEPTK